MRVELGCGKGRFTAETARQNPDILFIAVEKVPDAGCLFRPGQECPYTPVDGQALLIKLCFIVSHNPLGAVLVILTSATPGPPRGRRNGG